MEYFVTIAHKKQQKASVLAAGTCHSSSDQSGCSIYPLSTSVRPPQRCQDVVQAVRQIDRVACDKTQTSWYAMCQTANFQTISYVCEIVYDQVSGASLIRYESNKIQDACYILYIICMSLYLLLWLISMLLLVLLTVVVLIDRIAIQSNLSQVGLSLAVVNGDTLSESHVVTLITAVLRPIISTSCLLLRLLELERCLLSLEGRQISLLKQRQTICEISLDRGFIVDLLKKQTKCYCQSRCRYILTQIHMQLVLNNSKLIKYRGEIYYLGIVEYLLDLQTRIYIVNISYTIYLEGKIG